MTDPSFYYAIFKKLQATGASNGAHINKDNTPATQFYGGFSLFSSDDDYGIFGHLAPQSTTWGYSPTMYPLTPNNTVPAENPLWVMLNASLGTPGMLPDKVTVAGVDWPVMPPPLMGDISFCPTWLDFNAQSPRLIDALATWITDGKLNDTPKTAPLTFAALSATPPAQFPLKPQEATPILFVASMPGDDGRRHGDHALPDAPVNHVPANFWATSQIFLTDATGVTVHPAQLKPGEEYYVAAMIGNASGGGAGTANSQPEIDVRCDAMAFNTVLSPGVTLPSLGNLDATDSNAVYQQYFMRRLSYDVVGFRFNVDAVFAALKAALVAANIDLGGATPDAWLANSHPCVKVRITSGELPNTYLPSDNSSVSLASDPRKDRHIAQRNLAPFDMSLVGGKKIGWTNFIVAQVGGKGTNAIGQKSGVGANALELQHTGQVTAGLNLYLAMPQHVYDAYVAPLANLPNGTVGFAPVVHPPAAFKPFPNAVILRQSAAVARLVVAYHGSERFLGMAVGIEEDPATFKGKFGDVSVSHVASDGSIVGGFTLQPKLTK